MVPFKDKQQANAWSRDMQVNALSSMGVTAHHGWLRSCEQCIGRTCNSRLAELQNSRSSIRLSFMIQILNIFLSS